MTTAFMSQMIIIIVNDAIINELMTDWRLQQHKVDRFPEIPWHTGWEFPKVGW